MFSFSARMERPDFALCNQNNIFCGLPRASHRSIEHEEREALREAGRRLDGWMAEHNVREGELLADFERSRKSVQARPLA
jgi:hypothetical protein